MISLLGCNWNTMGLSDTSHSTYVVVDELGLQPKRITKRSREESSIVSNTLAIVSPKKRRCITDSLSSFDDLEVVQVPTKSVQVIEATRTGTVTPEPVDRRTVRFNLEATTIHSIHRPSYSTSLLRFMSDFTNDEERAKLSNELMKDRQKLWYTRRELFKIRKQAKFTSKAINIDQDLRQAFNSLDALLIENRKDIELSTNNEADVQKVSLLLSESILFRVQRGLERITCHSHESDRLYMQLRCKTEFFLEQSRQVCTGSYDADTLATLYHTLSIPSVTMARILGQADKNIMLLLQ